MRHAPVGSGQALNAPTKGAKFYSTDKRNANNAGDLGEINARRIFDFIYLLFNYLDGPI